MLELINAYSKLAEYNVNAKKSVAFSYTNNDQSENDSEKTTQAAPRWHSQLNMWLFQLRSWTQGWGIKPCFRLHAECGVCLRFILSLLLTLSLTHSLFPSLSFSKIKKRKKTAFTKALKDKINLTKQVKDMYDENYKTLLK